MEASYFFKNTLYKGLLYLLKKRAKTTAKAVGYGMPTIFTIKKINDQIQKEQATYDYDLFFVYPFDESAQKQNVDLRNKIVSHALETMPDEWQSCTSAEELLQKISDHKEVALKELKKIIEYNGPLLPWEDRKKASKEAIEKLILDYNTTNPDDLRSHPHGRGGKPDMLKNILIWLKKNGIDSNDIRVAINSTCPIASAASKELNSSIYTLQIHHLVLLSAPFTEGIVLHELNHLKTGDCDYAAAKLTHCVDKIEKINYWPQRINLKEILPFLKEKLSLLNNLAKISEADNAFSIQGEYHSDINPRLSDPTLTKQEKVVALKNYSSLFEHLLTFDAKTQIEAQQNVHHFFNRLQEGFGVNEHDAGESYNLAKQNGPTHPSTLSRYQLILRAIQLLSEKEH
jgi:hypothetical protein